MIILKGHNEVWIGDKFFSKPNLITTAGFNLAAQMFIGGAGVTHIALGSDPGESTPDMTTLGTEVFARQTVTPSANGPRFQYDYSFLITVDTTIGEFGLFTAAAAGTMFARWNIASTLIPANTTVVGTWYINVGSIQ